MKDPDGEGAIDVPELVIEEPESQAQRDQEPLDDSRQQEQGHGDPDERVDDAERLALGGQRGLVAVAYKNELMLEQIPTGRRIYT